MKAAELNEQSRPDSSLFARVRAALASEAAPILISELLFNFGFFAVVPFIALSLSNDFLVGAAAIGLVLGVRSLGQRGMFLVGGLAADRLGARWVILFGIAVRVAGFLSLSVSLLLPHPSFWLFVVGTFLTGLGGAFFEPGFQIIIAAADVKKPRRITLFAWLTVTAELGSVLGPVVGSFLIEIPSKVNGFAVVAGYGAILFALVGVVLWFVLPKKREYLEVATGPIELPTAAGPDATVGPTGLSSPQAGARSTAEAAKTAKPSSKRRRLSLPPVRFFVFSVLAASDGLAYNQLYLTIPLLLARVGLDATMLGLIFAWVSILTFAFQLPIARLGTRIGAPAALRIGYLTTALGFVALALAGYTGADSSFVVIAGALSLVILGHLSVNPASLSTVPLISDARNRGAYFGVLSSVSGLLVLAANPLIGWIFETPHGIGNYAPWLFMAAMSLISAFGSPRALKACIPARATTA